MAPAHRPLPGPRAPHLLRQVGERARLRVDACARGRRGGCMRGRALARLRGGASGAARRCATAPPPCPPPPAARCPPPASCRVSDTPHAVTHASCAFWAPWLPSAARDPRRWAAARPGRTPLIGNRDAALLQARCGSAGSGAGSGGWRLAARAWVVPPSAPRPPRRRPAPAPPRSAPQLQRRRPSPPPSLLAGVGLHRGQGPRTGMGSWGLGPGEWQCSKSAVLPRGAGGRPVPWNAVEADLEGQSGVRAPRQSLAWRA
jgi:hypothetical protein